MEDNNLNPQEDFKDFEDEIQEDLPDSDLSKSIKEKIEEEEEKNITPPDFEEDETSSLDVEKDIEKEEEIEKELTQNEEQETQSHWEETLEKDCIVKKYIVYIAKEYIPYIDKLNLDERSAYINDALEMKINFEDKKRQNENKRKLLLHLLVAIIAACATLPLAVVGAHKAIMATFDNYKYSQENFEKLYRQKFEKDRAYMRSVEYNKMLEKKKNK